MLRCRNTLIKQPAVSNGECGEQTYSPQLAGQRGEANGDGGCGLARPTAGNFRTLRDLAKVSADLFAKRTEMDAV